MSVSGSARETIPVRTAHRFDEAALAAWLDARMGGAAPLAVEQMAGGQSNPTFLLRRGAEELVLRKKPPGPLLPSAHAVDREFRVLSALHPLGIPVPRPLFFCEDAGVIGTPFYVMERMRGRVLRANDLPGMAPAERAAIYDAMNATLAQLHGVDVAAAGLADYGKPGDYYARQIDRWTRQWRASKIRELPALEKLVDWLPKNLPPDGDEVAVCHGDFRLENLMFDAHEPRVIAIFDWELSTLGPPLADLAYACIPWEMGDMPGLTGLRGLDLAALGIPTEAAFVARYLARTGRRDGVTPFHLAFSMFRLAAILEGVLARAKAGNAAAASAEAIGALGRDFADRAWEIVS